MFWTRAINTQPPNLALNGPLREFPVPAGILEEIAHEIRFSSARVIAAVARVDDQDISRSHIDPSLDVFGSNEPEVAELVADVCDDEGTIETIQRDRCDVGSFFTPMKWRVDVRADV
jgi:hypothetical protein